MAQYHISVHTGDVPDAGTDANVYITIHGSKGKSGPHGLDNSQNNFERNKTDHFTLDLADVGHMSSIRIGHDNFGHKPGWFLDRVVISKGSDTATFNCNRWLAADAEHATSVDLRRN